MRQIDDIAVRRYQGSVSDYRQDPVPPGENLFRNTFARLAAPDAGGAMDGQRAAKTAEIIGLEMMRSALSFDASTPSTTHNGNAVEMVLAVYDAMSQKVDTPSENSPGGGAGSVTGGTGAVAGGTPPAVCSTAGCPPSIDALIGRASRRYGVDAGLIKAVVHAESDFKPTAVSPAGARGLMQLMPATAAGLGVSEPFDPEQNIMGGTRFLKDLMNRYGGDLDKTLAAYNWGPGNLSRGKGRLPQETREYLVKVKRLYETYREG